MSNLFLQDLVEQGLLSPAESERIAAWASRQQDPIGIIAVEHGLIVGRQIDEVLERQRITGQKFGETAVSLGYLTSANIDTLLEIQQQRAWQRVMEVVMLGGLLTPARAALAMARFLQNRSSPAPRIERMAA
jgi:hypothetical protein